MRLIVKVDTGFIGLILRQIMIGSPQGSAAPADHALLLMPVSSKHTESPSPCQKRDRSGIWVAPLAVDVQPKAGRLCRLLIEASHQDPVGRGLPVHARVVQVDHLQADLAQQVSHILQRSEPQALPQVLQQPRWHACLGGPVSSLLPHLVLDLRPCRDLHSLGPHVAISPVQVGGGGHIPAAQRWAAAHHLELFAPLSLATRVRFCHALTLA